ncbi:MAG: Inositol 2-dehydrogenase/D-chiro-inositol 3-dehydrogenase [Verrucomicrobiae bacterium]|nr:Inositol 2-dehydrogenase/D-chiro-inositol 3-dehydrogenase [Verrucomicrobiae bacterium]
MNTAQLDVTIVGGGMITNDLILPSVYHLQRLGVVGQITITALNTPPLQALKDNAEIRDAFPGQDFDAQPALTTPADKTFPDGYKAVLAKMKPRQAVIVAVPDWFHYPVVMAALHANQHVLCVKPLVLEYKQSIEIEKLALEKGLFVGVEYHKRFDRRALLAKRLYMQGQFGDFIMGEAKLHEPYYYRHSNFQNWFTCDKADPFTYVGCHYVDLVYFITGLKPVAVSLDGVKGKFPNGNEGFLWSSGRVRYENGALLTVTDALGYPDDAAGSNDQGLIMYCEGNNRTGMLNHDDHERGVRHCYLEKGYRYINPDFYRLVPWEGAGFKPVGYGYESIADSLQTMQRIESTCDSLAARQKVIHEIDAAGIIATPANSAFNELVVEAARASILDGGRQVKIVYGNNPHVEK